LASYNKIILIGRLTADPELRYTPNGNPVANFTLAVNRRSSKEEKEADFINIVAWQKLAEICSQYLTKGKLIMVDGRLQTRTYEANDGTKRKVFDVVADNMQMLDKSGNPKSDYAPSFKKEEGSSVSTDFSTKNDPLDEINSEDIPF